MKKYNHALAPFSINLQGFDCFSPRVIYIDVEPSAALSECQKELTKLFNVNFDIAPRNRFPYHPHMTIAFKDLKEEVFPEAWAYFRDREYVRHFHVNEVALLKFEDKRWQVL